MATKRTNRKGDKPQPVNPDRCPPQEERIKVQSFSARKLAKPPAEVRGITEPFTPEDPAEGHEGQHGKTETTKCHLCQTYDIRFDVLGGPPGTIICPACGGKDDTRGLNLAIEWDEPEPS